MSGLDEIHVERNAHPLVERLRASTCPPLVKSDNGAIFRQMQEHHVIKICDDAVYVALRGGLPPPPTSAKEMWLPPR